jgi:hypothetical protein
LVAGAYPAHPSVFSLDKSTSMNKKIAILFISLIYGCQLFSQVTDAKKNTVFYQSLLKQLRLDNNIPIYDKTTLETLKKIDFKKN